ncbi:MAG: LVIVD repeat-containing protein, partial [Acidimicrobiales bacterium]
MSWRIPRLPWALVALAAACSGSDGAGSTAPPPPTGVALVAEVPVPANYGQHDQLVRAGLAFLCSWNTGLQIYDVGDGRAGGSPQNPRFISRVVTTGGEVHNAWWYWAPDGSKRYVFVGQEGPGSIGSSSSGDIHVVDVSNMAAPVEVAQYHMAGAGTHNFWVDEASQVLYAAYYNGGVVALDVSGTLSGDLASRQIAVVQPGGAGNTYVWGVALSGGSLYATDMVSGVWQLAPASGALQVRGGGNNVSERYSSDLSVVGGYAYTGTWGT